MQRYMFRYILETKQSIKQNTTQHFILYCYTPFLNFNTDLYVEFTPLENRKHWFIFISKL